MKIWGALAAVVIVIASPSIAQTVAQDEALITRLTKVTNVLGACQTIGFQVDADRSGKITNDAEKRLLAKGVQKAAIDTLVVKGRVAQQPVAMLEAMADYQRTGDLVGGMKNVMAGYAQLQQQCDALADAPETGAIVTRTGYQATTGSKSYLNLLDYQAAAGDSTKYGLIAHIYDAGALPDPGYLKELDAATKGAALGDPTSADVLSDAYFEGRGTTEDYVQAVKWGVIAATLGVPDTWHIIEPVLKPEVKTQGQALARAWLTAHGH